MLHYAIQAVYPGESRRPRWIVANGTRTTINISRELKAELDSMKHPGQSYNGIIWELIRFWKEKGAGTKKTGKGA